MEDTKNKSQERDRHEAERYAECRARAEREMRDDIFLNLNKDLESYSLTQCDRNYQDYDYRKIVKSNTFSDFNHHTTIGVGCISEVGCNNYFNNHHHDSF